MATTVEAPDHRRPREVGEGQDRRALPLPARHPHLGAVVARHRLVRPTLGLIVNSFRGRDAQRTAGWWTVMSGNFEGITLDNYRDVLASGAREG